MSPRAPTTDQLRHDIDSGATGEKVDFPDLATVPLGTDDEAAGFPPTRQERRMAAASAPQVAAPKSSSRGIVPAVLLFAGVIALMLLAVYFGTRGS